MGEWHCDSLRQADAGHGWGDCVRGSVKRPQRNVSRQMSIRVWISEEVVQAASRVWGIVRVQMMFEVVSSGEAGDSCRSQKRRNQQRRQKRHELWGKRKVEGVLGQAGWKGTCIEEGEGTSTPSL